MGGAEVRNGGGGVLQGLKGPSRARKWVVGDEGPLTVRKWKES
jgi:hypothetical protein